MITAGLMYILTAEEVTYTLASKLTGETISSLTDGAERELRYDSTKGPQSYDFIEDICLLLHKAGIPVASTTEYNEDVVKAVMEYQRTVMKNPYPSGTLNDSTLGSLLMYADKRIEDDIVSEGGESYDEGDIDPGDSSINPHYSSYFKPSNEKTFRKSRGDIKIVFGDNTLTKSVHDVFIRSQSVEVDTSGNPIYEVYEFIARDVTESDEPKDTDKYIPGVSDVTTPSDVLYDFSDYVKED